MPQLEALEDQFNPNGTRLEAYRLGSYSNQCRRPFEAVEGL